MTTISSFSDILEGTKEGEKGGEDSTGLRNRFYDEEKNV